MLIKQLEQFFLNSIIEITKQSSNISEQLLQAKINLTKILSKSILHFYIGLSLTLLFIFAFMKLCQLFEVWLTKFQHSSVLIFIFFSINCDFLHHHLDDHFKTYQSLH